MSDYIEALRLLDQIRQLFTIRQSTCNPVGDAEQKSLRVVDQLKSNQYVSYRVNQV